VPLALALVPAEAALAAETDVLAAAGALAAAVLAAAAGLVPAAALAGVVPLLQPASAATVTTMAAEVPNVSFTVFMCSRLFVSGHQADNPETPVGSARLGPRPTNSGRDPRARLARIPEVSGPHWIQVIPRGGTSPVQPFRPGPEAAENGRILRI